MELYDLHIHVRGYVLDDTVDQAVKEVKVLEIRKIG